MTKQPLISVIIPVYRPNLKFLESAIDSIRAQQYNNWEICLCDDYSGDSKTIRYLSKLANTDDRIQVAFHESNQHISAATNSAIDLAKGEFIAFMDQDDLLSPIALGEIALAINNNPAAQLLYSDEDKITEKGVRYQPHFKTDYNYHLLLAQNYISHLTVVSKPILMQHSGLRVGFEGSQDHDLILRICSALTDPMSQIVHVPKVLYHWRAAKGSTALQLDNKSYAIETGRMAVQETLLRTGHENATVALAKNSSHYKVNWPVPNFKKVSILIPTKDLVSVLSLCIDGLLSTKWPIAYEIIIIDNDSEQPETIEYIQHLTATNEQIQSITIGGSFNFSKLNNQAAEMATGDLILLLNNDIEVIDPNWFCELIGPLNMLDVGIVGAKLLYPDRTIQHSGVILGLGGVAGHGFKYRDEHNTGYFNRAKLTQELSAVTGACLLIRKEVLMSVGKLNEEHLKIAFNDIDLCLKVRKSGYKVVFVPDSVLIHHESKSRGQEDNPEKVARFNAEINYMKLTWKDLLVNDPYYNPNLSLDNEQFELANPPRNR